MRRIVKWVIRAYPSKWRSRYGQEFEALVDDYDLSWRDALDVVRGAVVMQAVRWQLVLAASALAGVFVGLGVSFLMPQVYESTSLIEVRSSRGEARPTTALVAFQTAMSRKDLADVIKVQGLYAKDMQNEPLEDVIDTMRRNIRIRRLSPGATFEVSFAYEERLKAQAANAMLVSKIMWTNTQQATAAALAGSPISTGNILEVTSAPTLPQRSVNRYVVAGTIAGLAVGLLFGSIIIRVRRPAVA
jgi:hypothetical protein